MKKTTQTKSSEDSTTSNALGDDPAYRITPMGILCLFLPLHEARKAYEALESRASRFEGEGLPAILLNGKGGEFIKIQVENTQTIHGKWNQGSEASAQQTPSDDDSKKKGNP